MTINIHNLLIKPKPTGAPVIPKKNGNQGIYYDYNAVKDELIKWVTVEHLEKGRALRDIANNDFSIHNASLKAVCIRFGIEINLKKRTAEENERIRKQVITELVLGESRAKIAKKAGVSKAVVARINKEHASEIARLQTKCREVISNEL